MFRVRPTTTLEDARREYAGWLGSLHEQLSDLLLEVHKQEEWEYRHPFTCATARSTAHRAKEVN